MQWRDSGRASQCLGATAWNARTLQEVHTNTGAWWWNALKVKTTIFKLLLKFTGRLELNLCVLLCWSYLITSLQLSAQTEDKQRGFCLKQVNRLLQSSKWEQIEASRGPNRLSRLKWFYSGSKLQKVAYCASLFVDLSKVFDMVDHNLMINIIEHIGLSEYFPGLATVGPTEHNVFRWQGPSWMLSKV